MDTAYLILFSRALGPYCTRDAVLEYNRIRRSIEGFKDCIRNVFA